MIFIKNNTTYGGKDFTITAKQSEANTTISLTLPDEAEIELLVSDVAGLYPSVKKSIEYTGKRTNSTAKEKSMISSSLLDNRYTEVAFWVKDKKISLVKDAEKTLPINAGIPSEPTEEGAPVRYPRDMIVFITEKSDSDTVLKCDPRNLAEAPINAMTEQFQVIIALVKWPSWSNLKFPVYMYLQQGDVISGTVQLGAKTENGLTKNIIMDADADEAKAYIEESERIMKEKAAERAKKAAVQKENKGPRGNGKPYNKDGGNKKPYNNNVKQGRQQNNSKGFQTQKNFRKSGNR